MVNWQSIHMAKWQHAKTCLHNHAQLCSLTYYDRALLYTHAVYTRVNQRIDLSYHNDNLFFLLANLKVEGLPAVVAD